MVFEGWLYRNSVRIHEWMEGMPFLLSAHIYVRNVISCGAYIMCSDTNYQVCMKMLRVFVCLHNIINMPTDIFHSLHNDFIIL